MRNRCCTFFFDEIQNIAGWERFIRRLLDTENVHICITGSSAKLLSREIATSLRGRSIATEIFPFSFAESLEHQGLEAGDEPRPGAAQRALLENRFEAYLHEGGFPEVQGVESEFRIRILQDYLDVVILRDLLERYQITGTVALRYLIRHLINSAAALFSVNKFYNDLKSQGIAVSKNTLHQYLEYLSDAYLFFEVPIHTKSERARMVNPRKVYAIDNGLVRSCSHSFRPDWGRLLENHVFTVLRREYDTIEYYKTRAGHEVDFVSTGYDGRKRLIQVAADMSEISTRKRELNALNEAMQECQIEHATIVTLNQDERLTTADGGRINILPAWRWTLFQSQSD
jgi:predicted AAA+ superfamily ATPase